jgi:tetratricopeptide (TPR) repeat protein
LQAYALVLSEQGRIDEARAAFQEGLRVERDHIPLWQAWGVFEGNLGNFGVARDIFQRGVESHPHSRELVWIWQVLSFSFILICCHLVWSKLLV